MKSNVTPNFADIVSYGAAAFGGCWDTNIRLIIFYKKIAEATRSPVGKISRVQRYKIVEKTEQ